MVKKTEKIAVKITNVVSSINCFWTILSWLVIWIVWNKVMPSWLCFDPEPYPLGTFIQNVMQSILMPLMLVSGGIQARKLDRLLHKLEAKENRTIELLTEILKKL